MLQAPALTTINGVTIFDDDVLFYKFYPIAAAPGIRLDENGRPIFLLVKYAFSDEDRIADPTLPAGGGYLNFDIQFDVAEVDLTEIRKQLKPIVDTRWQQLKNGTAAEQAQPGVAGTTEPPKVEFGAPTWTGGKVKMRAPQAEELVDARVAEAEPSLLAGNIAVFNMDMPPAGATFMQRTLVEPSGQGIDLTPIQVVYDLRFWARLPPVRIHIKVDSQKIHNYIDQMYQGYRWYYYDPFNFRDFDSTYDSMVTTGAINVQIDNGSGALPPEVIEELRTYSLDLVKQMIQSKFFSDTPPAPPAGEERPSDGDRYYYHERYFKQDYNSAEMKIEFNLEQRSVIEWLIHPQATLQTFFQGMSPEEIKQFVRPINLDDDFFANLQLEVRAFTDFADPDVANVEVQVHYEGKDENGQTREKNETFTFTNSNPQKWSVSLIGSERKYKYRYRVGFKGQEAMPFTDWSKPTDSPDLNISVPNPGKVSLTVLTGDIDFDTLVQQVQVRLAYEDTELGVPHEEGMALLNATQREDRYQRMIFKPRRNPIYYLRRFRMKNGDVYEDQVWTACHDPSLTINQHSVSKLEVGLLPSGEGWEDIDTVLVDMRYSDMSNNYTLQERLTLKSKSEFKTWTVPLRNPNLRTFEYRWLASYKNGGLKDSGWQKNTDENSTENPTVPIQIERQGIKIDVLPDMLDFAASPLTEVTLHYKAAGIDRQETFAFRDKAPQAWRFAAPEDAPMEYTVQITHYPVGGNPLQLPSVKEVDDLVVLKPYRALTGGKIAVQVFAIKVDFSITPLVTVDLYYDDNANNVHIIGALTFTTNETQTWEFNVKDINYKQFRYKLSYTTADFKDHPQDEITETVPRIVIPRYEPS